MVSRMNQNYTMHWTIIYFDNITVVYMIIL